MAETDDEVIWKQWDPLSNVTETFCDRQYLNGGIPKCLFVNCNGKANDTYIMAA